MNSPTLAGAVLPAATTTPGRNTDGAAWHERWTERLMYASNDLDCVVERNAHKWAAEPNVRGSPCVALLHACVATAGLARVLRSHHTHHSETAPLPPLYTSPSSHM